MEYIVTFEGGESAYLAHHGVKGMKWGVRNAETMAKYAGGTGSQRRYRLASRGDKYGQAVTNQRRAYNAKQSRGKQIAKNVVLTPGGAHAYNTSRSRGLSRSESLQNASLGVLYAQGVKSKQRGAGTTKTRISESARKRSQYSNSQSTGKQVVKVLLGGSVGATAYNTVRSQGNGRLVSSGHAAVNAALGLPVTQAVSAKKKR